jgi:hypothetical protein
MRDNQRADQDDEVLLLIRISLAMPETGSGTNRAPVSILTEATYGLPPGHSEAVLLPQDAVRFE